MDHHPYSTSHKTQKITSPKVLFCFLLLIVHCDSTMPIPDYDLSFTPSILDPLKTGSTMTGNLAGDKFGYTVSSAGDVNGDGYDDVIIGAHATNNNQGAVHVVYGSKTSSISDINLSSLASAVLDPSKTGFTITGPSMSSWFGRSVSAGDVDGDGYSDLIIGSYNIGKVYVIYGRKTPSNINLASTTLDPATTGFTMTGSSASLQFGWSVSTAGDINKDGLDDIVVGEFGKDSSRGAVYVIYGRPRSFMSNINVGSTPLSPPTTGFTVTGNAINDWLGYTVSTARDVNGDGYDDIIIGAMNKGTNQGVAYVIYGAKTSDLADIALASISLVAVNKGFTITGGASSNYFSVSLSTAGDVNGDGYDDVIVGADAVSNRGAAYVIYGGKTSTMSDIPLATTTLLPASTGFIITGKVASGWLGYSVNRAGDVNGDGYADVIVGAYNENGGRGATYVVYGGKTLSLANIDLSLAASDSTKIRFRTIGNAGSDNFGWSVSTAGDFNKDGFDDIVVGAYNKNLMQGAAYLIHSACILDSRGLCVERQFCQTCDEGASVTNPKCSSCPTNCQQYSSPTACRICDQGYALSNSKCKVSSPAVTATNVLQWISSILSLIGSAICVGSSIFLTPGLISKVVQYTRYIDLSVTDELAQIYKNWSTDVFSLGFPDSLSHIIQYKTLPSLFSRYDDIDAPFIANFWFNLMVPGGACCIYIFCAILKKLFAQEKSPGMLERLFAGSQNFLLVQTYGCLDDILFYLVLDAKTNLFNTAFSRTSLFLAIAFTCLGVCLIVLNFLIVKRYQRAKKNTKTLDAFTEKNKYLELFYSDFSDADSWSHSFLAFLNIQSILSGLIIATLYQNRFVQTIFLAIFDAAILMFLLIKKPIAGLQEKTAQYYFEILALMVHICTFILSVQSYEENPSFTMKKALSKSIIYMNIALIVGGICFMLLELYQTVSEEIKEYRQKQLQKQKNAVHPISENSDEQYLPSSSMHPTETERHHEINRNRRLNWTNNSLPVLQENAHLAPSRMNYRNLRMNDLNNTILHWMNEQRDNFAIRRRGRIIRNGEIQSQVPVYMSNLNYDNE